MKKIYLPILLFIIVIFFLLPIINIPITSSSRGVIRSYIITAPISGRLIDFSGIQKGNYIITGQEIGSISPDKSLVVETYVSPKDIGFIHQNQQVKLQMDTYNYNQWGLLTGKVIQSALDTESEQIIQKTLIDFKNKGRTMIIIAHRLSTIAFADNILVLEKGNLIEQGNHDDLIKANGKYASLWKKQTLSLE